jgi:GNAT superfamily N-acetyltransferase
MDNRVNIKEIQLEDYAEVASLNEQLGYNYPVGKIKNRISKILNETKDKVFVGRIDEKIVGYIHVSPYEVLYSDSIVNILGLVVDNGYRRIGIGKSLMEFTEKWAKDNKYNGIRLVSGWDREAAHKFYISCGFENRKNQKNFIKLYN